MAGERIGVTGSTGGLGGARGGGRGRAPPRHNPHTMAGERIGVTGSTGGLGGRVAARLADHGIGQRLLVRDASRAPRLENAAVAVIDGYDDADGMRRAL